MRTLMAAPAFFDPRTAALTAKSGAAKGMHQAVPEGRQRASLSILSMLLTDQWRLRKTLAVARLFACESLQVELPFLNLIKSAAPISRGDDGAGGKPYPVGAVELSEGMENFERACPPTPRRCELLAMLRASRSWPDRRGEARSFQGRRQALTHSGCGR